MRSMFTLIVCVVCDDEGLQKKLPQFLILSSAIARSSEIDHMRTMLPPNVFLWTRERAWTTTEVMVCVAKTLHACLREDLEGRQVIFSSDVYRAHIATEVWRAMARLNFFYFLIPAKMTWAMQPCDTCVRPLQEAFGRGRADGCSERCRRACAIDSACQSRVRYHC